MPTRKERIERARRPWKTLRTPLPRDWFRVISDEIPIELGAELFMLVRQLWLLGGDSSSERSQLFPSRIARHVAERRTDAITDAPYKIRSKLRVLMRMGRRKAPADDQLVDACEAIVAWAQDAGYSDIALHFSEAAAAAVPRAPHANFIAGRANRHMGDGWRAEVFYLRAIRLASQQLNWDVYVRANLGCGRLLAEQGRYRKASRHYATAAWAAKDQGHRWLAAQTYHDLLVLHYQKGRYETAREFAQLALETYPHHNERLPILVHDYGFLLVCMGRITDAVKLIEPLVNMPLRPHDQVLVSGTYARIMGAIGHEEAFADAEARVLALAPHHDLHAPFAYVNLGFGARALGLMDLALEYASRGVALAKRKNLPFDLRVGRKLLKSIRERAPIPSPAPPLDGEPAIRLNAVAALVREELAGWREDAWTWKDNQAGAWALGPV